MFTVRVDGLRRRVDVIITGIFDSEGIRAFESEVKSSAARLSKRAGSFDMIIDIGAGIVATNETTGMLSSLLPELTQMGLRRSAGITASALVGLQASRITERDDRFRTFATRQAAIAWIES